MNMRSNINGHTRIGRHGDRVRGLRDPVWDQRAFLPSSRPWWRTWRSTSVSPLRTRLSAAHRSAFLLLAEKSIATPILRSAIAAVSCPL
jgi:hypothetical protein